ncbi:ATP-binding cassette domain-containing protein [Egibacter rhizosphaerae]|uniref:ATP-binding cassette domain-containing protein n=1 Tax=Egibacter rhizosphaerae TaxID=1670831 RepID=UPI00197A767C|nr:ATP-binding cassette domain-containing protein [Egibacter rhizosphaerae]
MLTDVCAQVPASGITVVIGPSGAGKSTLLRLCNRLDVPTTGTVTYRGADLAGLDPLELRRRVGMVFQTPTPFAGTVRDNLVVAAPAGDDDRFAAALTAAALDPALLDRDADSLSGGEAQRACLARTLVADCEALLLDEPTSALDAAPKHAFERLAVDLAARGTPMLWVTHELAQLQRIADGVLALVDGALVHAGTPEGLRDVAELDTFLSDGGAS